MHFILTFVLIIHYLFFRFDEHTILNQTFKTDSVSYQTNEFSVSKYDDSIDGSVANINSEINDENMIEVPVNESFWYSKPIVMNLITQQMFFQLTTEKNSII